MKLQKITTSSRLAAVLLVATMGFVQSQFEGVQYLKAASVLIAAPAQSPLGEKERVFEKAKMFVSENYKMQLRKVKLSFTPESVSVIGDEKKFREQLKVPYASIKEAGYEYSSERRWGAAVLVSPLFLLSKGKKHWLTLVRNLPDDKTEEIVFQLDKQNYAEILAEFERASNLKVIMVSSKQ